MSTPRTATERANIARGQRAYWRSAEGRARRRQMQEDARLARLELRRQRQPQS